MEEKHFGPVWFIPGENRGRYPFCHSVYVEGPGVLIDPASDRRRLEELASGPGVREVWLSHWHEDHFMHLDLFEDLPLVIHELETEPLSDPELFMDWYGMDDPVQRKWWRAVLHSQFHYRPRRPARTFRGGERLSLGGVAVEVLHMPGHTPGHLAFWFEGPGVLFMGDYDLGKFGPWYGDRDSSIEATVESAHRLRELPARVWMTGHEEGLFEADPGPAWERWLGVIFEREQKLLDYLDRPRTLEEIVGQWIVYRKPREPKAFFEYGERALMQKHLERLVREGRVEELEGRFRALPA